MKIIEERKNKVVEYYNRNHSLEESLTNYKVNTNTIMSGSNYLMACPFHDDKSPSFSANYSRGVFKCFSCGRGGGVCKFEFLYQKEILGGIGDFNIFLDRELKKNGVMMSTLGFKSIFDNTESLLDLTQEISFKDKFKPGSSELSYLQLADKLIKDGYSESKLKEFILLVQGGFSSSKIYESIFSENRSDGNLSDSNIFNISSMMEDI